MAEGDINLATLWVPVVPSTEGVGPALEEAGKEGTESFGKGSSGSPREGSARDSVGPWVEAEDLHRG